MFYLIYILFSIIDPFTIELDNNAKITLAEPITWSKGDELEIHLNNSWFSPYTYEIVNQTTSTSVLANIPCQTLKQSDKAFLWIREGTLCVREDIYDIKKSGSTWIVPRGASKWRSNDPLLIGHQDSSTYPSLLINLHQGNYCPARFDRFINLFDDC